MAFKTFSAGSFGKTFTLWHIFSGVSLEVHLIGQLIRGDIITYIRIIGCKSQPLRHSIFLILQTKGGDDKPKIDK